jgi:hypothetical protein
MNKALLYPVFASLLFSQPLSAGYKGPWTMRFLAGSPAESGKADGASAAASFGIIGGIAVSDSGITFVSDTTNHRIRKILSDGTVSTFVGSTRGSTEGSAAAARLSFPSCIAIDAASNLYVAETIGYESAKSLPIFRVRKITPSGSTATLIPKGTGTVTSLAVFGSSPSNRNRLALSVKSAEGNQILALPSSGGTLAPLNSALGNLSSSAVVGSNRNGHLLVAANGKLQRLANNAWKTLGASSGASALTSDPEGNTFILNESGNIEAIYTDETTPRTVITTVDEWESDSSTSSTGWEGAPSKFLRRSKTGFLAVSPSGILSIAESPFNASMSKSWEKKAFWSAINRKLITDFADIQKLDWERAYSDSDLKEIIYDAWYYASHAIRQAVPAAVRPSGAGYSFQKIASTNAAPTLRVSAFGDGIQKLQWFRSGKVIPSAAKTSLTPESNGKPQSGTYNLELSYGTGSDRFSWFTPPFTLIVADPNTKAVRDTIASAKASSWKSNFSAASSTANRLAASSPDAAFLSGFTSFILALDDLKTSGILAKLGFKGDPNPFNWTVTHSGTIPKGLLTSTLKSFLIRTITPTLIKADNQLALIKDRNFLTTFPINSLFEADEVSVDYGDIQALRGIIRFMLWGAKFLESMNTDMAYDDLVNTYNSRLMSVQWILTKYPALLAPANGGAAAAAESLGHIKAAMDCYFEWSDFIKGSPTKSTQGRLSANGSQTFILEREMFYAESQVRTELSTTRAALDKGTNQTIVTGDKWEEDGFFNAKAGSPLNLTIRPLSLFGHPAGWRSEVNALAFRKNTPSTTSLTNPNSAASRTLKSLFPLLTPTDLYQIQNALDESTPTINRILNTK